jgi:outer membrane protein TolC
MPKDRLRSRGAGWVALLALLALACPTLAGPVLTLREAAQKALETHPDLRLASADVESALARALQAQGPFYPTLRSTLSTTWSGQVVPVNLGVGPAFLVDTRTSTDQNYGVSFAARQTLADFGRRHYAARAADLGVQASRADYQTSRQSLLLQVAESYFTVLREARGVEIQQANVRTAEERLRQAEGFYEAGVRARIDVTQAQSDLARARVSLIQAVNAERRARVVLGTLMGLPGAVEQPLADLALADPAWTAEEALQRALKLLPSVAAARARIEAAEASRQSALAEYRPEITAGANWAFNDDRPLGFDKRTWSVTVDVSVPLFVEPTLRAGVAQAQAALERARAQYDSLLLSVRQDVSEGVLKVDEARERLKAAQAAREAAQENFRLASERYRVGVGSQIEVSEAQRQLVEAGSGEVQARFDLQISLARLLFAVGALEPEALP